jgi:prepilin-type N-terminal cleavage/methylation domain-containing protein
MTRFAPVRRGVTLIELLVVMAVITALAGLALMIAPGIMQKDNTLKGTSDVQTAMKIAQSMAAAAKLPRGVRLIAPPPGASTAPNFVTELQYLEVPPILVPDPQALVATAANPQGVNGAQVNITYTPDSNGAVTKRQCFLFLPMPGGPDQALQILPNTTLTLPALGFFSRIIGTANVTQTAQGVSLEVILEVYPDAYLGGATAYRTYHFGIYGAPRPLLGEPTIQLPKDICIDLSLCLPQPQPFAATGTWQNYDIIFAPSGQLLPSASRLGGGQIFLWVRDYTKVNPMPFAQSPALADAFRRGGEQQIVGIRGAAIGTAPAKWPDDMVNGTYTNSDQYTFARLKLTGQ